VVDVTEINIALCLNSVSLGNIILNDTDTFVGSVSLVDVIDINSGVCVTPCITKPLNPTLIY
jgi:hypothetical protein